MNENNLNQNNQIQGDTIPNNTIPNNQGVATPVNQNLEPATPFQNTGMYQTPNMGNMTGEQKPKKKAPLIILGAVFLVAIVIVITTIFDNKNNVEDNNNKLINENTKSLIVYYSHDGENYGKNLDYDNVVNLEVGNTEVMSKMMASYINADLFEIEPTVPYSEDLEELFRESRIEINKDIYPEIKDKVDNLDSYDVIFIGYPIWHNTFPQIIKTFLRDYKDILKNKIVIPFNTHAGSGSSGTYKKLFNYVGIPEDRRIDGIAINGVDVNTSETTIKNWLESIGYKVK